MGSEYTSGYVDDPILYNVGQHLVQYGIHGTQKRHWHRCFPVNSAKFLRTHFLQNTSGRLLLKLSVLICTVDGFKLSDRNVDKVAK